MCRELCLDIQDGELLLDIKNREDRERAMAGLISLDEEIEFICSKHGSYTQKFGNHYQFNPLSRKYGCALCAHEKVSAVGNSKENRGKASETLTKSLLRKRKELVAKLDLSEVEIGDRKRILDGELSSRDIVSFVCSVHGVYKQKLGTHFKLSTGEVRSGCPVCARETRTSKFQEYSQKRRVISGELLDDFYNEEDRIRASKGEVYSRDLVKFRCPKHGFYVKYLGDHFDLGADPVVRKSGCNLCTQGNYTSKFEQEVKDFLLSKNPSLVIDHPHSLLDLGGIRGEVDIYIHSLRLGIECNGSYYHQTKTQFSKYLNDRMCSKEINYHQHKFLVAKQAGIHLINLFDVDWVLNPKIRDYLEFLVRGEDIKVYARNTEVHEVSRKESLEFENLYHLQGAYRNSKIFYGLFVREELLSLISLGEGKEEGDYILNRYTVKKGVKILGGFEKLLSKFAEVFRPKRLITYSWNDYFLGSIYKLAGFREVSFLPPRYYWTNAKTSDRGKLIYIPRRRAQLSNIKKIYPDLYKECVEKRKDFKFNQEDYILSKANLLKVYRSGKTKWVKYYEGGIEI